MYVDRSDYLNSVTGKSIGQGLFAGLPMPAGARIITYKGSMLSTEEYNKKSHDSENEIGYTLQLTKHTVLDCSKYAADGTCFASMANTPRNTVHYKTGNMAKANAKIVISSSGAHLLVASISIPRYAEILTPYGCKYKMVCIV